MQEVENAVKHEVINQLSKNKMLKVGCVTAMDALKSPNAIRINSDANKLTLEEITNFKKNLKLLMNPQIDDSEKRLIAGSMKQMQRTLKKVQVDVNEQDFNIFYAYHIGGQTVRNLSASYGITEGTIRRARIRVLNKITKVLYPEIILAEIFE